MTEDAPDLGALQAERDFLFRSLDDLEAEREAGNLDADRYRALHDDYTARAAAVLRSLQAGAGAEADPAAGARAEADAEADAGAAKAEAGPESVRATAPPSRRRRLTVVAAITGFVVTAAGVMALAVSDRGPGDSATGNQQTSDQTAEQEEEAAAARQQAALAAQIGVLRQDVADNPSDAAAHRQLARALLNAGDIAEAVKEFDRAAQLNPADAESLAYGGWVVFLAARGAQPDAAGELVDGALRRLDAAVAADADFPDARFFRGMVLFRGKNNPAAAVPELERYLALVPDGPQAEPVRRLLEQARADSTSTTGGSDDGG